MITWRNGFAQLGRATAKRPAPFCGTGKIKSLVAAYSGSGLLLRITYLQSRFGRPKVIGSRADDSMGPGRVCFYRVDGCNKTENRLETVYLAGRPPFAPEGPHLEVSLSPAIFYF